MTEPDVIDRIVAGVLEQLRLPSAAAPRPVESSPAAKPADSKATPLEIRDSVITGTLLEERGDHFRSDCVRPKVGADPLGS